MGLTSKALLKKAGLLPKLRLGIKQTKGGTKSTGPHKVKLLEEQIKKKPDQSGKEVEYVRLIVEENGEQKYYDTKLRGTDGMPSYLVQNLAEIKEGDDIILEMKSQGAKNYIDITPVGHSTRVEMEDEEEEEETEPTINLDESPI